MTLENLLEVVLAYDLPKYSARQIASWIYKRRINSIEAMTDLSKTARKLLAEKFEVGLSSPIECMASCDGTKKYLFEVENGKKVESVLIPDHERATLCVSSQIGCRMNCGFCMTGSLGFHGNLTANEIINQILSVPESQNITNVVFMGMGEPLDNLVPVLDVLSILTSDWGLEWSPRRITVSTVGKLNNMRILLDETKVHIAVSVHTPFPEERVKIMPAERAYPIKEVIDLLSKYNFSGQRRCSIEYIMWEGINDDMRHADYLSKLLKPIDGVRVNLIRYHYVPCFTDYRPSSDRRMVEFRDRLNKNGITAPIRASRGEDIFAACGMLAGKNN